MNNNINDKIHNITSEIMEFIDLKYQINLEIDDSLQYKSDKYEDDDMVYIDTNLGKELRSYLTNKLTELVWWDGE